MAPILVKILESPTASQIEDAVSLCLRAYGDDKAINAMTGNNPELKAPLFRSMFRATVLEGTFYVASDGSDGIFAIALWFGPGKKLFGSEEQRALGFNDFFEALSPETKQWYTEVYIKQLERYLDELFGPDKLLNSWYANNIATDPIHQGKGYGTALIKTVFERSQKEGRIAALGTQKDENATWYISLGFRMVGRTEISAPTGNFPAMFFTWGDV